MRVSAPSAADRTRLSNLGLDLTERGSAGFVDAVLHSQVDESILQAAGFAWKVEIADLAVRQKQNNEISAAYAAATATSPLPSGRDTYRTLADYESELHALAQADSSFVRLVTLTQKSLEGPFSNLVLRPPGVRSTGETSDEPAMAALGAKMAAQNGYRNIRGWQLYDTTGTT